MIVLTGSTVGLYIGIGNNRCIYVSLLVKVRFLVTRQASVAQLEEHHIEAVAQAACMMFVAVGSSPTTCTKGIDVSIPFSKQYTGLAN